MRKLGDGSRFVLAVAFWLAVLALGGSTALAQTDPCVVTDNGTGTVNLPPRGCAYLSPQQVHAIIDGLPAGTTIELDPIHRGFFGLPPVDGGTLGGQVETFESTLVFRLHGTRELDGFDRLVAVPATVVTHTAPRTPGARVQDFDTDMFQLQGSLFGDPDFDQLQITAGTGFGLPSPGHTTLSDLGDGTFNVDSFFDISYQIDFVGAPGGALAGLSGSTQGVVRVEAHGERDPCVVVDDGTGTVELPPPGCEYLSPDEVHEIINGLPAGTEIKLSPRHRAFFCQQPGGCGQPGGNLGGEVEQFNSELVLQLEGTGSLAGFRRTLRVPTTVETHTGPRTPGDAVQSFPTDMFNLQGNLVGDPDFASLQIVGGTNNGLPSPGHTTLTDLGDGTFQVDSFFDITYQIDFVGAPFGALAGLSGSTQGQTKVRAQAGLDDVIEPDDGTGTVTLPPKGSGYVSPRDLHMIIDGLPPGTEIEIDPKHWFFFCGTIPCGQPGGTLGGQVEVFQSTLEAEFTGTGSLDDYRRRIQVPVAVETHTAPRLPPIATLGVKGVVGAPQSFATDMFRLQGGIFGDPDFDELLITAGTGNGLPSPGHTTLTDRGDGTFLVDSFFDITYQIDFVGAPGGALDGMSGSTQGTARLTASDEASAPDHDVTVVVQGRSDATDFPFSGGFGSFSLDDDADPTLPGWRTFYNLLPGVHTVTETPPAGWDLVKISCDDPDGGTTVDPAAGQAKIDLDLGESITCTFWNDPGLIFTDGFESGDVSVWSSSVGSSP